MEVLDRPHGGGRVEIWGAGAWVLERGPRLTSRIKCYFKSVVVWGDSSMSDDEGAAAVSTKMAQGGTGMGDGGWGMGQDA